MDKPKSIILIAPKGIGRASMAMARAELALPGVVYVNPYQQFEDASEEVISGRHGHYGNPAPIAIQITNDRVNGLLENGLTEPMPIVLDLLAIMGDTETPKFFDKSMNAGREIHVRALWSDPVNAFDQMLRSEARDNSINRDRDLLDLFKRHRDGRFKVMLSTFSIMPDLVKTFAAAPFIETVTLFEYDAVADTRIESASWIKGKPSRLFAPADQTAFEQLASIDLETAGFEACLRKPAGRSGKKPKEIGLTVTNLYGKDFPPLQPDRAGPKPPHNALFVDKRF